MTNHNKYFYNPQIFTQENEVSFYLLGVFITDGNVSYNTSRSEKKYYTCEIKSADYNWLLDISKLVGDNLNLTKANNSSCYRLRINNTEIGNWLINNECVRNKTLSVKFPNIPEKYVPDFIRGCWDGDGSFILSKRSNCNSIEAKIQLYSASKVFINSLRDILKEKYEIVSYIYEPKMTDHIMKNGTVITAKNQLYTLSVSSKHHDKFIKTIYYDTNNLCLDRKYIKANSILDIIYNRAKLKSDRQLLKLIN